jgi:hypothetical protein
MLRLPSEKCFERIEKSFPNNLHTTTTKKDHGLIVLLQDYQGVLTCLKEEILSSVICFDHNHDDNPSMMVAHQERQTDSVLETAVSKLSTVVLVGLRELASASPSDDDFIKATRNIDKGVFNQAKDGLSMADSKWFVKKQNNKSYSTASKGDPQLPHTHHMIASLDDNKSEESATVASNSHTKGPMVDDRRNELAPILNLDLF